MSMHIEAKVGDIAKKILLPGDPLRAKYIAETYFENPRLVNQVRGALCYTGTYNGTEVSVMGTGMGIPAVLIYATELCRDYGCEQLVRLGTAGGFDPKMKMMDIVLSQATSTYSSLNDHWFKGSYAPCADFQLLHKAYHLAQDLDVGVYVGNTVCNDLLYRDPTYFDFKQWYAHGIIASEMEGAALYTVAAEYKRQALTIMTVSGNPNNPTADDIPTERRERGLDDMIVLGLRTLCE